MVRQPMSQSDPRLSTHAKCPRCNYDLHGLAGNPIRCPECGIQTPVCELHDRGPVEREAPRWVLVVVVLAGAGMWLFCGWISGAFLFFDNRWYWRLGLPLGALGVVALAAAFSRRAWRWSWVVLAGHALGVALSIPKMRMGPLIGVPFIILAVLALVLSPVAWLAGRASARFRSRSDRHAAGG
jgi:hypothetical protein